MLLLVEFLLFLGVLLLWWSKKDQKRYAKLPPGPRRWPIVGNLLQVMAQSPFPSTALKKLSYKYGDVFFMKMGSKETVVFNTFDTAKEMLLHEATSDRNQDFEFIKARQPGDEALGIIWGNGKAWQNLRRFTMRNLRDFGFGKSTTMDVVVNEEIDKFIAHLRKKLSNTKDNIFDEPDMFSVTFINVLWRLASGKSYELDDPVINKLVKLNSDFFRSSNISGDLGDIFPILRKLFPKLSGKEQQYKTCAALFEYGKKLLKEQRDAGGYKEDPQSFIDVFTGKVDDSKGEPDTDFKDDQFVMVLLDLLIGGSETSSNTMNFGLVYMVLNPEVQAKVHAELDRVLGEDEILTSDMKQRLPYTNATVLEILRYSTVIPLPAPREATQDFVFRGKYFIPKGMSLQPNIYSIHHDDALWGDAENFRPERFLNEAGTGPDPKAIEKLLAFGAGKRYCLGQSLAEVTMLLYFARMMREFKFVKVPGTHPTSEPILGLTLAPRHTPIQIIERRAHKK